MSIECSLRTMNIVFIALQLSQPRCIKRIKAIYDSGFQIKVYGFDSGLYNDSLNSLPFPVERIIKRDKNKSKLMKIWSFISPIRQILHENKKESLFYLFGFEIASLAYLLGCKKYIYEEADVTAARTGNSLVRDLMLVIDRRIIKRSYRTVLTSRGFVSYIFPNVAPKDKFIMMPNKLSPFFDEEKKQEVKSLEIDAEHIKFGFIGLIRYPNTIVRFARVIGREFPQHEFHFWGDVEREDYIDEETRAYKNVFVHGRFKNPNDLMKIYEQTDVSIVCYDTVSGNVRIAEPNKIYESIFFETPIVVSSGTFLADRVKEFGIGYDIDASKDKEIISFLNRIDVRSIESIILRMKSIPWQSVVDDSSELMEALRNIGK